MQDHLQEVIEKWDSIDDEIWAKVIVLERNRRVAKGQLISKDISFVVNSSKNECKLLPKIDPEVELNTYQTDLYFLELCHKMTNDCLLIFGFLPVFVCWEHKIVLHIYM